jgi:hypothetical protein
MTNQDNTEHPPPRLGYEKRDVNIRLILIVSAVLAFIFVFAIWATWILYEQTQTEIIQETVVAPTIDSLRKARETERAPLYKYEMLDSEAGIYSIPIDSAMKMMAEKDPPLPPLDKGGNTLP